MEVPGGNFITGPAEVALRTMGRMSDVDDFNRIVLTYKDGAAITFADVGRVQDAVQEIRGATRLAVDGSAIPSIIAVVSKQSGTNTVEVVDRVLARLAEIQATLPPDLTINIGSDQSRFIRRSFEDIRLHLFLGSFLACCVVFLFIRNLRVTFIAALAVPTSIIGTFTFMKIVRLHAEQHDDARAVAGDRHRHRRCDRRAGERVPVSSRKKASPRRRPPRTPRAKSVWR